MRLGRSGGQEIPGRADTGSAGRGALLDLQQEALRQHQIAGEVTLPCPQHEEAAVGRDVVEVIPGVQLPLLIRGERHERGAH